MRSDISEALLANDMQMVAVLVFLGHYYSGQAVLSQLNANGLTIAPIPPVEPILRWPIKSRGDHGTS